MNIYIYDSYVTDRRNNQVIAKIETRLTDLGLNGKIFRLNVMNSVLEIINNEVKKGANTFVAVGNRKLLCQCINSIAHLSAQNPVFGNVSLGFIPVGKHANELAEYLGLEINEKACDNISARRIKKLDLGVVNQSQYFLTSAQISTDNSIVEIDSDYSIEILKTGTVSVVNLPYGVKMPNKKLSRGDDGNLELLIEEKSMGFFENKVINSSVFSFKTTKITNKKHKILLDDYLEIDTPAEIRIANERINLIVGKNRSF